jgi:hypothetical protein
MTKRYSYKLGTPDDTSKHKTMEKDNTPVYEKQSNMLGFISEFYKGKISHEW